MKKTLIAVAAAAALFMASAAAEVTFGVWINTLWSPVASDGDDIYSDAANSWGGMRQSRLNIDVVSEDEKAGAHLDAYVDNDSLGLGDWAFVWAKPIDQIKILMGKIDDGYAGVRGDFCLPSWGWMRAYNWVQQDEGLTFSAPSGDGVLLDIAPVDFIHIIGWVPTNWDGGFEETAEKMYGKADVIATVGILDVAKIKVGWFGNYDHNPGEESAIGNIEAAVDLSIIDPLWITIGFQYKIADEGYFDVEKDSNLAGYDFPYDMKITAGVSYTLIDALTLALSGGIFMYTNYDSDRAGNMPMELQLGFGVTYDMSQFVQGLSLMADVRWLTNLDDNDYKLRAWDDDTWSFMVGATYGIGSNALIGVAFEGVTNGSGWSRWDRVLNTDKDDKDNFSWCVPVRLSVWF